MYNITYLCIYLSVVFAGNYWSDTHNQRKLFIEFASQQRFDPLVAANWENIPRREIIKQVKR